jgi:sulfite dehydrogenase (cytochrome) subunit B
MKRIRPLIPAVLMLIVASSAAFAAAAGEESIMLADAPGRELTVASCAVCHSLDYLPMNAAVMNRAAWEKSIHKMIDRFGAPIDAANIPVILDYLALHYSAGS